MKVVLYIGHHKVGSTTLQQFLAQNSNRLLQQGILYPSVESEGLAYNLSKAITGQDVAEDVSMNIREPHNALAFRMWHHRKGYTVPPYHRDLPSFFQMMTILKNQVSALNPHTILICSEVMANFGKVDLFLIDQIREMFGKDVELEIYCALRRPDEYLVSWHGQRLRFGGKFKALRDGGMQGYFDDIHFDYRAMLEPWVKRCTRARFHIRTYAEIMAAGGSTADFTAQVGVEFPDGLLPAARLNTSYPHSLFEIARLGNHALDAKDADTLREFLMFVRGDIDLPANADVEMYGAGNRARLSTAFAPIEDWLRQVTDRPAFFKDLAQMQQVKPLPELEAMRQALDGIHARKAGQSYLPETVLGFLSDLRKNPGPVS
jgi:hypothetical protein